MRIPLTSEVKSLMIRRQVSHKDLEHLHRGYRNIFVSAEYLPEVAKSEVRINVTSDELGENA